MKGWLQNMVKMRLPIVDILLSKTQSAKPKFVMFAAMFSERKIRVAILDLNEGLPNQGMRCIRQILDEFSQANSVDMIWDEFEVRLQKQVPDLSYDIYISSGGPGSPLASKGTEWDNGYFNWLHNVESWNNDVHTQFKKQVLFICHSYQLACRYFNVAHITKRRSTAFGVFPVHLLQAGKSEPVFNGMTDPFYAVDSRDFQVIQANKKILQKIGAKVLCIEKERPHVPLERAIMAIRFNENMIGTQFHPEADAEGMTMYLKRNDKKETVIANHGEAKWKSMIEQLNDPDKIMLTQAHIIPNFLRVAIEHLQIVEV
jgi:homoserine O-succinyltransferase/O-acetyltransferase